MLVLGVFVAGAAGAICRYLAEGALQQRWRGSFPIGTFAVNVSGSLLLGVLVGFLAHHSSAPSRVSILAGTGFLGAYTTFSALTYDTLQLARAGALGYALANLLGSMAAGFTAAALGSWAGGAI